LAKRDGQWVGRILAQVYKPEFTPVGASRWQFGSLDAVDDIEVVRALTLAAEGWLKARGADRINGPFSPTINGECGMLVDGFEATPMFLTPGIRLICPAISRRSATEGARISSPIASICRATN